MNLSILPKIKNPDLSISSYHFANPINASNVKLEINTKIDYNLSIRS